MEFMMISTKFAFCFLLISSIIITFCPMNFWAIDAAPTSLGNETDQLALFAFKAQITQDPLQVLNSWNASQHFCKWHGVTCGRRHQRVVKLNLMSCDLVGSLSPHIGNLSFLRMLDLANNSFSGEIPSQVGCLFRLKFIRMTNNSFVGGIPISLANCSDLSDIRFSHNNLRGTIPNEFTSLKKLRFVGLSENNLTGHLPPSFGNLSVLDFFSVTFNNLHGSIPESVGQVKSLRELRFHTNMLSSTVPPSMYNLSSLEILSISVNQFYGTLPPNVGLALPNLQEFYIEKNQFHGSIPTSLFNCSKLIKLDLGNNNFTGQVPTKVGNLKDLQQLNLNSNQLGSGHIEDIEFISSMLNCSSLRILDVSNNNFGSTLHNILLLNISTQLIHLLLGSNQISGSIPSAIENLANLTFLDISKNKLIGSIPMSIGKLQNLQKLILGENYLSAQIPSSLFNLSQLFYLNLSYNYFEGGLNPSISNCQALQMVDLSRNKLNGAIPKHMFTLPQLVNLSLGHNSFIGSLPIEVDNLKYLVRLDVSNNEMTGEIPSTLGSYLSMEQLYLAGNSFQGPIPRTFVSLKGLKVLDLSQNNLNGKIPAFLQNLSDLQYLNLSFNNLEGEVPIHGVFQNASAFSIHGNNKLCGGIQQLHLPPCPANKKSKTRKMSLKVSLVVTLISIIVFASFLCVLLHWRRRQPTKKPTIKQFWEHRFRRVSYQELHQATNGFAPTNLIGNGSFGVVYKGVLCDQGETPLAVKVLNLVEPGALKTFMAECEALRKVRHRNLLKIITACSSVDFEGNDFKALIFPFMPNGSLENWLHPTSNGRNQPTGNMTLSQRINIAIDIASALDYLHNHCEIPIIHCDLKPSNVLLDEEMVAHVNDFGLAKFLHNSSSSFDEKETSSIHAKGTIGYIPPEYGLGEEASKLGDVYSYGILLLEIITGKKPTNDMFKDGLDLHHYCSSMAASSERVMKIIDQRMLLEDHVDQIIIVGSESPRNVKYTVLECLTSIARVGIACSMKLPSERLDINAALKELLLVKQLHLQTMMHGHRGNDAN